MKEREMIHQKETNEREGDASSKMKLMEGG